MSADEKPDPDNPKTKPPAIAVAAKPPVTAAAKPPAAPATKLLTAVDQLVALSSQLTEEQRAELFQETGVALPCGDPRVRRWGLVCTQCGDLALVFLGDKEPSVVAPIESMAWVQREGMRRTRPPKCQRCGYDLVLSKSGGVKITGQNPSPIVDIEVWRKRRAEAARVAAEKVRKVVSAGVPAKARKRMRGVVDDGTPRDRARVIEEMHEASEEATGVSREQVAHAMDVAHAAGKLFPRRA